MEILVAIIYILLGISFLWKSIEAAFFGRFLYWEGFKPFTFFSPFFTLWPPTKNSLIKTAHGWWAQVLLGPIFFFISLVCLCNGADKLGLPGTQGINYVLTFGRPNAPEAISYSRLTGYRFPFAKRAGESLLKILTKPISKTNQNQQ